MPALTSIGGFYASLGLQPDKNSFETGNKLIDGVADSFSRLIGVARNAAVVLGTTAIASGVAESKIYKTAEAIGTTTQALNVWRAAAKIAGVNADGLVSSMGKLGSAMNSVKYNPDKLTAYEQQLWKLGVKYKEIQGMSTDKAFEFIIAKAQSLKGQYSTAELAGRVADVLGEDGMNFFIELGDTPIADFLKGAEKTQFTNAESEKNARDFEKEVNEFKVTVESLGMRIGGDIGGVLTPYMEKINTWLQDHGEDIADGILKVVRFVEELVKHFLGNKTDQDILKSLGKSTVDTVKATADLVEAVADGDFEGAKDAFVDGMKAATAPIGVIEEKMATSENATVNAVGNGRMDEAAAEAVGGAGKVVKSFIRKGWNWIRGKGWQDEANEYNPTHQETANDPNWWMDDGIMRPDGTITRVAPDDWVIAAKNLGDVARAFIPQGMGSGAQIAEYSIVQNFTINGGSDLPQVLRQQAYNGVQDGLMAMMNQSSTRLQHMSGTR